jgi:hypothetical protein
MVEQIRLLQADIRDRIRAIEEVYEQIGKLGAKATGSSQDQVPLFFIGVGQRLCYRNKNENVIANEVKQSPTLIWQLTLETLSLRSE